MNGTIELPTPVKDGLASRVAIPCGADAVYLGAPRFSAREAGSNTIPTTEEVTAFAHQHCARVYVAWRFRCGSCGMEIFLGEKQGTA